MITQLGRRSMLGFAGATVRPAGSSPGVTQALRRPLRVPAPILAASASAGALGPASTSLSSTAGARRLLFLAPSPVRHAANPQSGKPASDNVGHMVQNIKEEAKSVTSSVESSVAGSRKGAEEAKQSNEIVDDAKSIMKEMSHKMPRPAVLWGAFGIIPYVSTASASIYLARQTQLVADGLDSSMDFETASALLLHAENVQITYGAVLLSFLGAIHWGFEFSRFGGELGNRRYMLGLVPVMCAWPSLLMGPQFALLSQWAAYVLTWFIDLRATTAGWAPQWYSSYRFMLTLAVGVSILATLAGTNYYDADKSRSSQTGVGRRLAARTQRSEEKTQELLERRSEGRLGSVPEQTTVGGDVEAAKQDASGDSFVKIRNPKREEEERKKKEEEEQKKKKEEAEKAKEGKEGKEGKE